MEHPVGSLRTGGRSLPQHLSAPPLYTISETLLHRILLRNGISEEDCAAIREHCRASQNAAAAILETGQLVLVVPELPAREFEAHPLRLPLSGLFFEQDVFYDYAAYQEHLALTKAFAAAHASCVLKCSPVSPFRNIQITILEGRYSLVSKGNAPAIHFLIEHSKMVRAFEQFIVPIAETAEGSLHCPD